jgi:hypothetical protein
LGGEGEEIRFVDEIAFGTVGEEVAAAGDGDHAGFHADVRCEAAEKKAAWFQDAPGALEHVVKMGIVAGEVEDCATEDDVGEMVGERMGFEGLGTEPAGRERGNRAGIGIHTMDVVVFAEEIGEVAAGATAGIEDTHARVDSAAKQLVEEINIDGAELLAQAGH